MTLTSARGIDARMDIGQRPVVDLSRSSELIGGEPVTAKLFPYVGERTDRLYPYGVEGPHALFVVPGIERKCWVGHEHGFSIAAPVSVDELAEMYRDAIHQSVRGGTEAEIAQLDDDVLRRIFRINHSMLDQPKIAVVRYNLQFPGDDDRDARDVFDISVASALDNFTSAVDELGASCYVLPLEA